MDDSMITFDRRLPDPGEIRSVLQKTNRTWCEDHGDLDSLVRILYPVYRIRYSYVAEGAFPWSTDERQYDDCLIDGLGEGNSDRLVPYLQDAFDPATVYPEQRYDEEDVGTQLLEFQQTNGQVSSTLDSQLSRLSAQNASPEQLADASLLPPADTLALFENEEYSFDRIEAVSRIYLPFWLARLESDDHEYPCYLAIRDVGNAEDASPVDSHPWLATFATEHPELLTEYRRESWLETPEETASASGVEHETREPTEPEDSTVAASEVLETNPERSFEDVAGMGELKHRLQHRVIEPYRNPEQFEDYGLGTVDGVLLYGPPGCGKTYISGALAGELDHEFIRVTPADITSRYMGEPAQKVADLFEIARLNQPCLVFIDEIDALASQRSGDGMNASERQVVNQLLTELEAVADEDVMVMAATNRIEDIDSAIRRSGRFDERIEVPPPDTPARKAMIELHLSGRPTGEIDLETLVSETAGYAASDIELIVESGARKALKQNERIETSHLMEALDETETSIGGWTDSYPELFSEENRQAKITQPEGVEMDANAVIKPNPSRGFDDVGGLEELISKLEESVIEPLKNQAEYAEYGLEPVEGLMLYGPPGCGKTYLTGALAGELGYHFLPLELEEIVTKWAGRPATNIADLFAIARANQPCIVFLDEIDTIAGKRNGEEMNARERQLVNQLLDEIEAVIDEDVIVVATTNLLEDVDPAILSSGQFDEQIEVLPPDAEARRDILETHLEDRPTAEQIDWEPVIEATSGYAASDLTMVAESGARRAFREDEPVDGSHLEAAAREARSSLAHGEDLDRYEAQEETTGIRYLG